MDETLKPCPLCGSTDIACFVEECVMWAVKAIAVGGDA